MRILYHSAVPWLSTGYARVTREVATRVHNTDHKVAVQCLGSVRDSPVLWNGEYWDSQKWTYPVEPDVPMTVYPSSSRSGAHHFGVNDAESHFEDFDADFYFTHFDSWMNPAREIIPDMRVPYSSYVIVDHYPVPDATLRQVQNAQETIAMSKYAKQAIREKGLDSTYIPHGVNTDVYRPLTKNDEDYPAVAVTTNDRGEENVIDLDSTFVFGVAAANFGDRKLIPNQMEAFSYFINEVDEDAQMYLHTAQKHTQGYDLRQVQKEVGIPDENIIWQSADVYHNLTDRQLNKYYNSFDVMLNTSAGESWGLTVTEAMAAGVPVIVTDFSSMPEQLGAEVTDMSFEEDTDKSFKIYPHGLAVVPSTGIYREKVSCKQYICKPKDIFEAMKWYYNNRDKLEEHSELAREYVKENYTWEDHVIPKFVEHFDRMEEQIKA